MHSVTNEQVLTLEEYEALPGDDRFIDEVSHGQLVRAPQPAYRHGRIVARIAQHLLNYVDANLGVGRVVAEAGFILEDLPLTMRGPDVAFVRAGRPEPELGFGNRAAALKRCAQDTTPPELRVAGRGAFRVAESGDAGRDETKTGLLRTCPKP